MITARRRLPVSLALLASGLVGCASLTPSRPSEVAPAAIAHAYEQGVRDAHAQLAAERGADPRAMWTVPVVQEVWIPAQIVRGVFLPGHREWVVIPRCGCTERPTAILPGSTARFCSSTSTSCAQASAGT